MTHILAVKRFSKLLAFIMIQVLSLASNALKESDLQILSLEQTTFFRVLAHLRTGGSIGK